MKRARFRSIYRIGLLRAKPEPLFHGTRYSDQALRSGWLEPATSGNPGISLTRNPDIALHFALLQRDRGAGDPAIFIFDRRSLRANNHLELRADGWPDDPEGIRYEAEECTYEEICLVSKRPGLVRSPLLMDMIMPDPQVIENYDRAVRISAC
jgi:hypothetical protein